MNRKSLKMVPDIHMTMSLSQSLPTSVQKKINHFKSKFSHCVGANNERTAFERAILSLSQLK